MTNFNRRHFFKVAGATAAAGAVACDPRVPKENVLPYVVQPEQIIPGVPTFFATQCNECPTTCGVVARNREGRIIKLEGNPEHPTSRGRLCAMGQQGLQATYSPDRFAGPMVGGQESDWDTALAKAVEAVKAARSSGKTIAWLGQHRTGATGALIGAVMGAVGGKVLYSEPVSGISPLKAATKAVFGLDTIPNYDLSGAHTVVSFGAEFLSTWGGVDLPRGWADSRDPSKGGFVSRTVVVEPRAGNTSAMADLHLQAKPGTEAMVALALAKLVADKRGYSGPAKSFVAKGDPAAAAAAAGISAERLEEVAGWMAEHPSVVMPGGLHSAGDATELAVASLLLNEVAGNIGRSVTFGSTPNVAGISSYADEKQLIADAAAGKVGVVFLDGADPAFTMPAAAKAAAALDNTTVVAFANEPSDSLGSKAIVLPPGTTLESWGDAEAKAHVHTLQQATMNSLHNTRGMGDVLLAMAQQLGVATPAAAPESEEAAAEPAAEMAEGTEGEEAAPAPLAMPDLTTPDFRTWLSGWWKAVVWDKAGRPGDFDTFWTTALQRGGWFAAPERSGAAVVLASAPAATEATAEGSGDLHLVVFPHPFLYDGRHANKPWAQEVPEPLSSYTWGTWVELHPETAASMGLSEKDEVTVTTAAGSINAAWFGSPSIRKDTVAVVLGNGHERSGRYTRFGANAMKLVGDAVDAHGNLRYSAQKASVSASGNQTSMHKYLGNIDTDGRGVNYVVSKEDLGKGHGPASIVSMHHPPVDPRLIEAGLTDMYPEPEHPTYRFAMAIDLNRCTGCGACETACFAENNTPVVGPEQVALSRHMGWIRLSRYWEGEGETPDVRFQPNMCQQCSHAPCEGVCPVLATYHNLDGLNAMVYNRCVGTRYCANNCPYTARRFNYHSYKWPESFNLMLNPDVVTREMGVMEKCSFCVQRLRATKDAYRDLGQTAPDSALRKVTACAETCPTDAITFGNLNEAGGDVAKLFEDERAYAMLGELNTKPGVRYLARINHIPAQPLHHAGGHGDAAHGDTHGGGDHGDAHGGGHGHEHDDKSGDHGHGHGKSDEHGHDGHGDKH